MAHRALSEEVVSLVHHVELNDGGWWKKAVNQVIRGLMYLQITPQSSSNIQQTLFENGVSTTLDVIERQLEVLMSQGQVFRLPNREYKLSESAVSELRTTHEKAVLEQEKCKSDFLDSARRNCPGVDPDLLWSKFSAALVDVIRTIGANTFNLLNGTELRRDTDWISAFLGGFHRTHSEAIGVVISDFFRFENRFAREHVLRLLSAHFFAEATQLRPETLRIIENGRKKRSIKIVLDTNFVFSILRLHDNPANDSADMLLDLAKSASKHLNIRLYLTPATLDEAMRTIDANMHNVEHIRTTRAISGAALHTKLSGMAERFFRAASESPGLTAEAFFGPYVNGLKTILEKLGIVLLDTSATVSSKDPAVVDDIAEIMESEKRMPEDRRKSYETVFHDVALWHAINQRRSAFADTPFDVEYWGVSIDWRLIAFDKAKRQKGEAKLPVILYPTNLIQLIQFWVPRSPELDSNLIESLRLPLFFHSFDPDDERVTLKILGTLSRFTSVDDIPEAAIAPLLANQALRARIRDADLADEKVFELIQDELLTLQHATQEKLSASSEAVKVLQSEIATVRASLGATGDQLVESQLKRDELAERLLVTEGGASALAVALEKSRENERRFSKQIQRNATLKKRTTQIAVFVAVVGLAYFTVSPNFSKSSAAIDKRVQEARVPNQTSSQFLSPADARHTPSVEGATLLLFVHGIFGDTVGTWKNENSERLDTLLRSIPEFREGVDSFAFGFPSSLLATGSFDIVQAAKLLQTEMDFRKFAKKYKKIVIVTHSMGGLVTVEALTSDPTLRENVALIISYATPYEGSQISLLADKLLENKALANLVPRDMSNSLLESINIRWKNARDKDPRKIKIVCAYETVAVPLIGIIVPPSSAAALCDLAADPISENHIGIVKPGTVEHQSVKVLVNALRKLQS